MSEVEPGKGPFQPYISDYPAGSIGTGPSWKTDFAKASLFRIHSSATVEEAQAQATTEVVMLLHSIRRILLWMLVIVPVLATVVWLVLIFAASALGSGL